MAAGDGIEQRTTKTGERRFRGRVWDPRARRWARGPWGTRARAVAWRDRTRVQLAAGTASASSLRLDHAVELFLDGLDEGTVRNRSGRPYKPSTVRGYRRDLRAAVRDFHAAKLDELTAPDLQGMVARMTLAGAEASSARNAITAVRALYRWAVPHGWARRNPTRDVLLPAPDSRPRRVPTLAQAMGLVGAAPDQDRPPVALAAYAGLRLGEILALDASSVDVRARELRVSRAWDPGSQRMVAPKTKTSARTVPIVEPLAAVLDQASRDGLVCPGRDPDRPCSDSALRARLRRAWADQGVESFGFHDLRHGFASMAIAAGMNPKEIQDAMGHSSIQVTFDLYGHLFPGARGAAREALDRWIASHQRPTEGQIAHA